MRVISMVPSWTETLLELGVDVVGRTRYCIHPQERVRSIPVVGGTKDIRWKKVQSIAPDLVLLDREENPKSMSEESPIPVHSTHVQSLSDMPAELKKIGETLNIDTNAMQERWLRILRHPLTRVNWNNFPGVKEWLELPKNEVEEVLYLIWKNPYMVVSRNTFIGSVLQHLGLKNQIKEFDKKYPEIKLEDYSKEKTLLLFSSEPFPFEKHKEEIKALGFPSAIVNGESFSWFGARTLLFLEQFIPS